MKSLHTRLLLCLLLAGPPCLAQNVYSGTITGTGCVSVNVTGRGVVGISITGGSWSGTIQPEVSIGGDAAQNTTVTPYNSASSQNTITGNGTYQAYVTGASIFYLCGNTVTNTASVKMQPSSLAARSGGSSGGGSGTVTSAGLSINSGASSGLFAVTGSPVTSSGTLNVNLTGTSGGIPYFSSGSIMSASGALASHAIVQGGGAGSAPATGNADFTIDSTAHTLLAGSSGLVDFSAASVTAGLKFPTAAGAAPTTDGFAAVNSTNHNFVWGCNGSTCTALYSGGALGTPASGVITNLTGTCTSCNVGGNAATATGISTNGTANQVWGMNSGGSAQGWQTVSGSGNMSDGSGSSTAGYFPATTTTAHTYSVDTNIDDGHTTASTITFQEPLQIVGSTHGITIPAGTAVSGAASKVVYAVDTTNGYAEVNENNTGLSRVCTAANGICSGGSGLNGTVTYTSSQTASTSDNGKLVIMNCSSACAYTLPTTQPSTTWAAGVTSQGSTLATIALGGSDTFNGSTSVPALNSYRILWVFANTATSTDYRGDAPLIAGSNMTFTSASNGLTVASSGGGSSVGTIWQYVGIPSGATLLASSTFYMSPSGVSNSAISTTETSVAVPIPACTAQNLYFTTGGAQPSTGNLIATVRRNGGATSITVTVAASAAAGTFSDTTHTQAYSAGDTVDVQFVNNATSAVAIPNVSLQCK